MQRIEADQLVKDLVVNQNLINHMLCVEAAMRFYAIKMGGEEELWGLAGLLHDADWEKYPDEHPQHVIKLLREKQADPGIIQAINAHGGKGAIEPKALMDKVLFACDELCGFVVAVARIRPTKFAGMEAASIQKKLKDKGFAANVNRDDIYKGAELIGVELDVHISNIISALTPFESQLFS